MHPEIRKCNSVLSIKNNMLLCTKNHTQLVYDFIDLIETINNIICSLDSIPHNCGKPLYSVIDMHHHNS